MRTFVAILVFWPAALFHLAATIEIYTVPDPAAQKKLETAAEKEKLVDAIIAQLSAKPATPPPKSGLVSSTGRFFLNSAASVAKGGFKVTAMTAGTAAKVTLGTAGLMGNLAMGSASLGADAAIGAVKMGGKVVVGGLKIGGAAGKSATKLTARAIKFALDTTMIVTGTKNKLHKAWGTMFDFADRIALGVPSMIGEKIKSTLKALAYSLAGALHTKFTRPCGKMNLDDTVRKNPWLSAGMEVTCLKILPPGVFRYKKEELTEKELLTPDDLSIIENMPVKLKLEVVDGDKLVIAVSTVPMEVWGSYNMHLFGIGDRGFMRFIFDESLLTLTAQFAHTDDSNPNEKPKTTYDLKIVGCDMILVNVDFSLEKSTSTGAQMLVNTLNAISGGAQAAYSTMVKHAICYTMKSIVNDWPSWSEKLADWAAKGMVAIGKMAENGIKNVREMGVLGTAQAEFFERFKYKPPPASPVTPPANHR